MRIQEELKLRGQMQKVLHAIYNREIARVVVGATNRTPVSALQGTNQAHRIIAEIMAEGALTLSQEGTVLYCNPAFARLLCRPLEQVIGARFAGWVGAEDQTRCAAWLANATKPCWTAVQLVRGDGAAMPVQLAASRFVGVDLPGVICVIVSDLTERERRVALEVEQQAARAREEALREREAKLTRINAELAEEKSRMMVLCAELNERARQLKRGDAKKTRFLANLSHEIRSPLNSIFALTTLLLRRSDGELSPEQHEHVGFIRKAADSLLDLVNDLLDLAQIEAGKIQVHLSEFEAAELLDSLRGMLPAPLVSATVRLVFEEPAGIPSLSSDEGKVSQILRNFVDNALKFTARGEVRVAASHDPANDQIIFSVRDTGIGLAPADQERIFDEFTQLENPAQGTVKGLGLGLPLCRRLAVLLGGRITLESEVGAGSKFSLVLPRRYQQGNEVKKIVRWGGLSLQDPFRSLTR